MIDPIQMIRYKQEPYPVIIKFFIRCVMNFQLY